MLANCPFCGNKAELICYKKAYVIVCTSKLSEDCFEYCGYDDISGIWFDVINKFKNKQDAINMWNKRV